MNYTCLEYTFNNNNYETTYIFDQLTILGFTQLSTNTAGNVTIWSQNLIIIIVVCSDIPGTTTGLSGIGVSTSGAGLTAGKQVEDLHGIGLPIMADPAGFRLLCIDDDNYNHLADFEPMGLPLAPDAKMQSVDGVMLSGAIEALQPFYSHYGFDFVDGVAYDVLNSQNRKFSLVLAKHLQVNRPAIIVESPDAFFTTAKLAAAKVTSKDYNLANVDLSRFDTITHLIAGYGCTAVGSTDSYSIENRIYEPLPNVDIIIRSKKQFIGFDESMMREHYDG